MREICIDYKRSFLYNNYSVLGKMIFYETAELLTGKFYRLPAEYGG